MRRKVGSLKLSGLISITLLIAACTSVETSPTSTPQPPTTTPIPPTATQTPTPSPTLSPTPTNTLTPQPTATPVEVPDSFSAGPAPEALILSPEEVATIVDLPMGCIQNAFESDETFSGRMCLIDSSAIGSEEIAILIYILTHCPDEDACEFEIGAVEGLDLEGGSVLPLPQEPLLPENTQILADPDGDVTLSTSYEEYGIILGIIGEGDSGLIADVLAQLAALQIEVLREHTAFEDQLEPSSPETWLIHAAGYGLQRPPFYTIRTDRQDAELEGIGDVYAYFHGEENPATSLNEGFENIAASLANQIAGFEAGPAVELVIHGAEGLEAEFSAMPEGGAISGRLVIVNHQPGWGMMAVCLTPRETWETDGQQACGEILDGLIFFQPDSETCETSTDRTYGTSLENPIQVGGGPMNGPSRQWNYLSALRGPNGEMLEYVRAGTGENAGVTVDIWEVNFEGLTQTFNLYLDEYNYEDPIAPAGFTCPYRFPFQEP